MANLTRDQSAAFEHHMSQAKALHDKMPHDFHSAVNAHNEHVSTYINHTVREGLKPTVIGLRSHIANRMGKEVDKVSTAKAKAQKVENTNAALKHHDDNVHHFKNALAIHHHITQAKNILVGGLNKANKQAGMEHHIDTKETNPEGYVAHHNGQSIKLVDRQEFSRANFAATKAWKSK